MVILKQTEHTLLWRVEYEGQTILVTAFEIEHRYNWKYFFSEDSQDGKMKKGDEVPREMLENKKPQNSLTEDFDFGDEDPGI